MHEKGQQIQHKEIHRKVLFAVPIIMLYVIPLILKGVEYLQSEKIKNKGQRLFIDISQDESILLYPCQEYRALLLLDIHIILLKGVITDSLFLKKTKITANI
jgi:hypothetical protein